MPSWKTPTRLVPFLGSRVATFFYYPQALTVIIYQQGKSPHVGLRATPYPGQRAHTTVQYDAAKTVLQGGYRNLISEEDAAILRADDERWDRHIIEEES